MARDWTPRQAGYRPDSQIVTTTPGGGLVRHFVVTRHGLVARTWCGHDLAEVALLRPRNHGATYQGSVRALPGGGWAGFDPGGKQVTAVHDDYLNAEAPLLRSRSGHRSSQSTKGWPVHLVRTYT